MVQGLPDQRRSFSSLALIHHISFPTPKSSSISSTSHSIFRQVDRYHLPFNGTPTSIILLPPNLHSVRYTSTALELRLYPQTMTTYSHFSQLSATRQSLHRYHRVPTRASISTIIQSHQGTSHIHTPPAIFLTNPYHSPSTMHALSPIYLISILVAFVVLTLALYN
jgi:hypothetical protein